MFEDKGSLVGGDGAKLEIVHIETLDLSLLQSLPGVVPGREEAVPDAPHDVGGRAQVTAAKLHDGVPLGNAGARDFHGATRACAAVQAASASSVGRRFRTLVMPVRPTNRAAAAARSLPLGTLAV